MKKTVIAFLLTSLSASSTFAADVATRSYVKAPVATQAFSWNGFYIGGDVGGAVQSGDGVSNFFQNGLADNVQPQSFSPSSVIGGVHAGYNWQFAPSYLLGIEADAQWLNASSGFCRQTDATSAPCTDNGRGFLTINNDAKWLSTVRGRLGWTFDRYMIFGTGGVAFGETKTSVGFNCGVNGCGAAAGAFASSGSVSVTNTGWVAGGGLEWLVSNRWAVRAEYLHVDLGNAGANVFLPAPNCAAGGPCGASLTRDVIYDIGRVGISYKFGGPAFARF